MHETYDFIHDLAVVLCVAGITSALCRKLRQPAVLGYLIAGMLVGPHIPIPIVARTDTISTLAELGVMLVMFSLGLDFTFGKLVRVGPASALIAIVKWSVMVWAGYSVAQAFHWSVIESIYTGVIVSITSTMIVAQTLREKKKPARITETIIGVMVVEDLLAFVALAVLTGLSSGASVSAGELAGTLGRFAGFLAGMIVVGILIVPRVIRAIVRLEQTETIILASIGACFAFGLVAHVSGFSVALGSFIAGALVAESRMQDHVEPLIAPVRDLFAAIFFVAVGMLIDPALVREHWVATLILTAVVLVGASVSASVGSFFAGRSVLESIQIGMVVAVIGEFSFIVARIGEDTGVTREFLLPIAVAVCVLTTVMSSGLVAVSGSVARFVDRNLPRPLQTFATLYGSWIENLRADPPGSKGASRVRRLVRALLVDAALLAVIVIATSTVLGRATLAIVSRTEIAAGTARLLVVVAAILLSAPPWFGIVRNARLLALALSGLAWPEVAAGQMDLAAAPRRAFVLGLQLTIILILGAPLVAVTQPFLPPLQGAGVLAIAVVGLALAVWRSASNLQGHVRAGAQMIVQVLAKQATARATPEELAGGERGSGHAAAVSEGDEAARLERISQVLPGLGFLSTVHLSAGHHAVGRTLSELDVRGRTGATVLAISRDAAGVSVPTGRETLRAGDILCMTGTHDAIDAARALLGSGEI
jgi:CPA2 family monovalent cation:H+ antiporter-2